MIALFVSLICSVAFVSCISPPNLTSNTIAIAPGSIVGRIIDGDSGFPLGSCNINTQPGTASVFSDSSGQFTIENVQPGNYSVIVTRTGYPLSTVVIAVNAGSRTRADIALFRRGVQANANQGSIEGRIVDSETFRPIAGVSVSTQPPTNSLLTDSLGRFTLNGVAVGNYTINAARNGYVSGNAVVAVLPGQQTRADIPLTRSTAGTGVSPVLPAQGRVSVFASGFSGPAGIVFDAIGNLYVANNRSGTISRVSPNGTSTIFASGLRDVSGVAFDAAGNLYVSTVLSAAQNAGYISRITPNGSVGIFASNFTNPIDIKFDRSGTVFVSDRNSSGVTRISSNGTRDSFFSSTAIPYGLTFDLAGNLFLSATDGTTGNSVFRAATNGTTTLFSSAIRTPAGLVFDTSGNLYVASFLDNSIVRITRDGSVSVFATIPGNPTQLTFDTSGNLYVSSYNNNAIYRITP